MASMTVNDYIDVGTGGVHVATSWQFAKDKDFTLIIDESIKDYKNIKKWHSKLPKREEDKSSPDAEEYYTELDELWGRCKILVGETESEWFVVGPMSQRNQRVMVTDRTVENEEDPEGPLLTHEYMSNSTALGWTEEVFDQDDPDILGPIIKEPEPEEPEVEEIPEPEEDLEEQPGGDGMAGDPILPDMEFIPSEPEEDDTVIIPEEDEQQEPTPEEVPDQEVEEPTEQSETLPDTDADVTEPLEPLPNGQDTEGGVEQTEPAPESESIPEPEISEPAPEVVEPSPEEENTQPELVPDTEQTGTEQPSVPSEEPGDVVLPEQEQATGDPVDEGADLTPENPTKE